MFANGMLQREASKDFGKIGRTAGEVRPAPHSPRQSVKVTKDSKGLLQATVKIPLPATGTLKTVSAIWEHAVPKGSLILQKSLGHYAKRSKQVPKRLMPRI